MLQSITNHGNCPPELIEQQRKEAEENAEETRFEDEAHAKAKGQEEASARAPANQSQYVAVKEANNALPCFGLTDKDPFSGLRLGSSSSHATEESSSVSFDPLTLDNEDGYVALSSSNAAHKLGGYHSLGTREEGSFKASIYESPSNENLESESLYGIASWTPSPLQSPSLLHSHDCKRSSLKKVSLSPIYPITKMYSEFVNSELNTTSFTKGCVICGSSSGSTS